MTDVTYKAFHDPESTHSYLAYQGRFRDQPKDCDVVLAEIVRGLVLPGRTYRLLDVGCAGGHAIGYLRSALPDFELTGIDLRPDAIEWARRAYPEATFVEGDFFEADLPGPFDFVVESTAFYPFTDEQFERALAKMRSLLRPGGFAILFDLFHHWEQHVEMIERSVNHPRGHRLMIRPFSYLRRVATDAGFEVLELRQFTELSPMPKPVDPYDLRSYTEHGLILRGSLAQPFFHAVLRAA